MNVRVQTFKHQFNVFSGQHFFRHLESTLKFPVGRIYPLKLLFIVAVIRVIYKINFLERIVYGDGDMGWKPKRIGVFPCRHLPERPRHINGLVKGQVGILLGICKHWTTK